MRILTKHSSKLYKRCIFGGNGPRFGQKSNHNIKGVKTIDDKNDEYLVEDDHDVDDVGCIVLDTGSALDDDFEGVLCVETELPVDVVDDFVSNAQLN